MKTISSKAASLVGGGDGAPLDAVSSVLERGAPAWPSGITSILQSLVHCPELLQSQDVNSDLLKLLSVPRHGLASLSYSLELYTISIFSPRAFFVLDTILRAGKGGVPTRSGMWLYHRL